MLKCYQVYVARQSPFSGTRKRPFQWKIQVQPPPSICPILALPWPHPPIARPRQLAQYPQIGPKKAKKTARIDS